jgi:hypothetical protein
MNILTKRKEECLSHLILFGERSLRKALTQFQEHYHEERNHQGLCAGDGAGPALKGLPAGP